MSINIPDSLPKLLILLGIIGMAIGVYVEKELTENYSSRFDKFDKIQDAVSIDSYILDLEKENLKKRALQLSEMYNIENPVIESDSTFTFSQTFSGDKLKIIVTDSLNKYWFNYVEKKQSLEILRERKRIELENLENKEEVLDSRKEYYGIFFRVGLLFFILGIGTWALDNSTPSEKIIKQNDKVYKFCQSCGFKFSSIRPYGTEKNKTQNLAFCIECYTKGKISEPELTKEDFINRKKEEIKDKVWLSRKILMARFHSLERWNKDSYF